MFNVVYLYQINDVKHTKYDGSCPKLFASDGGLSIPV